MKKNLIESLREIIEEKGLSPEEAARHIEVNFRTVYRWIKGETKPSAVYRRAIKLGIKRMKRLPSVQKPSIERDRELYLFLKDRMTNEEKIWLMDVNGDYKLYRRKLHDLAAEYGIKPGK